jgi:hypothetical protein
MESLNDLAVSHAADWVSSPHRFPTIDRSLICRLIKNPTGIGDYRLIRAILLVAPTPEALLTQICNNESVYKYCVRFSNAGYGIMKSWAIRAVLEEDLDLQAAVCEKLASMGKSAPYSANDFAKVVIGMDHFLLTKALETPAMVKVKATLLFAKEFEDECKRKRDDRAASDEVSGNA